MKIVNHIHNSNLPKIHCQLNIDMEHMEHHCDHRIVFELLAERGCGCHGGHHGVGCDGRHRIYIDHAFKNGDFIYYDTVTKTYKLAIEGHCDFLVLHVDRCNTWIEVASTGVFILRNYTLTGHLYINSLGSITNTVTNTKLGFIENGIIYLLIEQSTTQSTGTTQVNSDWNATTGVAQILNKPVIPDAYSLPVASSTILGGVKIGSGFGLTPDGTISVLGVQGNYIDNQKAVKQVANMWIGGNILSGDSISINDSATNNYFSAIIASSVSSISSADVNSTLNGNMVLGSDPSILNTTNYSSALSSKQVTVIANNYIDNLGVIACSNINIGPCDMGAVLIASSQSITYGNANSSAYGLCVLSSYGVDLSNVSSGLYTW